MQVDPRIGVQVSGLRKSSKSTEFCPPEGLNPMNPVLRHVVSLVSNRPVWGTIIDIEMEDGSRARKEMALPLDEEEHPFNPDQVRDKLRGLVPNVYNDLKMEEIICAVDGIEKSKIGDKTELL